MTEAADAAVQVHPSGTFSLRARIAVFVGVVQFILILAHWFIYDTWATFRAIPDPPGFTGLQVTVAVLSVSFVAASLLAFRYYNWFVRAFYRVAAVWLGTVNFLFLAACACWAVYLGASLTGLNLEYSIWAGAIFGLALLASLYGVLNARLTRIRRITVKLPNLPASWRGRVAALVSDVHLGHVNGLRFMRRIVAQLGRLKPDVVFLTGDLYDGSKVDAARLAAPWKEFSAPLGAYFVTGNHEEFSDPSGYLEAVGQSGVRVLRDEKVMVDGLQIVGVYHQATTNGERFRSVLMRIGVEAGKASVLLSHAPQALSIAEDAGISLQLSGHTHGGQFFPFTWFTRRIFGVYTYGLQRFRKMLVYTTTGVGTWGPPLRLGANPEIVLIEFA